MRLFSVTVAGQALQPLGHPPHRIASKVIMQTPSFAVVIVSEPLIARLRGIIRDYPERVGINAVYHVTGKLFDSVCCMVYRFNVGAFPYGQHPWRRPQPSDLRPSFLLISAQECLGEALLSNKGGRL